jgi:SAM-dependent methyltransferase
VILRKLLGSKRVGQTLYNTLYKHDLGAWDRLTFPHYYLKTLVEQGRIRPCRAVDLGCGSGGNAVYLAENGFEVTAVDWSRNALDKGRRRAEAAGVEVDFVADDLLDLSAVRGQFDLVLDGGTQLPLFEQTRYWDSVLPLMRPGSEFVLFCLEWPLRWWEKLLPVPWAFQPGEVQRQLGRRFDIERFHASERIDYSRFPAGEAVYLMNRRAN